MNRTEMVKARAAELSKLSDTQLVDTIIKYFNQNATLPGEKAIKDYALTLKGEFDGKIITGLLSQVRNELIEEFASLCIKEVKLKHLAVKNVTKKNKDVKGLLASDLPMELSDVTPTPVKGGIITVNDYVMCAEISDKENHPCITESIPSYVLGQLPAGFKKNHRNLIGMKAVVIAKDYSNGKFANMSYKVLIDLGQTLAA